MTNIGQSNTIRACFDDQHVTLYQAYSGTIADAAVATQNLAASASFKKSRTTWIKPSWCWMMYRCGFSYKDSNQERVLAIRMKHEHFLALLENACLASEEHTKGQTVVVQWDPERGPALQKLDYRSIQIGIPSSLTATWTEKWIANIEDVTVTARALKTRIDEDGEISLQKLIDERLIPLERAYSVPESIAKKLSIC